MYTLTTGGLRTVYTTTELLVLMCIWRGVVAMATEPCVPLSEYIVGGPDLVAWFQTLARCE